MEPENLEQEQTQDQLQEQGTYYWGTAIYAYEAQTDKEISFQEGEQIYILQDHGDGWSTGEANGIQGLFPTEYVQVYSEVIEENNYADTDYYNQDDAYGTSEQQKKNEEAAKKKQERKEKLKGEMRDLKEQLGKVTSQREQLEKDMKELSDLKQKLRKDLRVQKAELSDSGSLFYDLIKLCSCFELFGDGLMEVKAPSQTLIEALNQFQTELTKEGKGNVPLTTTAQKFSTKSQELKTTIEKSEQQSLEILQTTLDLQAQLTTLYRLWEKQQKSS